MLDLLYANYTFVNPELAKHYGMPGVDGTSGIGFVSMMRASMDVAGPADHVGVLTQIRPACAPAP